MILSKFFDLIVKFGKEEDPGKNNRSITGYADSAVLHDSGASSINKILVGIDIDSAELVLADRIRQIQGCDLVISHHPQGKALAGLYGVMLAQVDVLRAAGVDEASARGFIDDRLNEVKRRLLSANHLRTVDAARLLNISFVCCHTPADNHAYGFVKKLLSRKKPAVLKDVVSVLLDVPEYAAAEQNLSGPKIILGSPKRRTGPVLIEMTGGTEGPQNIYKHLYKCGVRTLVSMHMSEDHLRRAADANLNVVIAGHISSDTLGMNLLLDKLQKAAAVDITAISGFRRIKR